MRTYSAGLLRFALAVLIFVGFSTLFVAAEHNPCPRFPVGSTVSEPENLFSHNGLLRVNFSYQTGTDEYGNTTYCFINEDGAESPTLHLSPGDTLILTVTNLLPPPSTSSMSMTTPADSTVCGSPVMNTSSVNLHYHGTNTSPMCGADDVIHTLIDPGQTFTYTIAFPSDEPPGLYWYHPHVHGLSESAVQGGATGAIVIDGIERIQPAVSGLPERILLIRDYPAPPDSTDPDEPGYNLSLNYIPVPFPKYPPAVIRLKPWAKEFWRVGNLSADTIIDVQVQYDGKPQTLQIVGLDGVPTGSQDGSRRGRLIPVKHLRIPTASRAEFIVTAPGTHVKKAVLLTRDVDTGPDGDTDPLRPLATLQSNRAAPDSQFVIPAASGPGWLQRFEGLMEEKPTARRLLYFSEDNASSKFYITVEGAKPTLFSPDNPPAIVTTQGSVEDWTIQNRSLENHEFHIHQIHYLLLERNGIPVPPEQQQFLDTVDIPFWKRKGPYPSVTVRMDFRGRDVGDFVYHCHILEHEDDGMMAIIRVLPQSSSAALPRRENVLSPEGQLDRNLSPALNSNVKSRAPTGAAP
ncbi:MAG: multicopper oxidase domain-containing protein [Candidatus Sulfotelmatobacter sp.]